MAQTHKSHQGMFRKSKNLACHPERSEGPEENISALFSIRYLLKIALRALRCAQGDKQDFYFFLQDIRTPKRVLVRYFIKLITI
jgi:hypothetical protein